MAAAMRDCLRAVPTVAVLIATVMAVLLDPIAAAGAEVRWEVTMAVRVSEGSGNPVTVRVALPYDSFDQRLLGVEVAARGFTAEVITEGDYPHVLLRGRFRGARRVAVTYRVERDRQQEPVPPVGPVDPPVPALLPFVSPAPLFQSRSILVRDFLERYAAPVIGRGNIDPMRAIYEVTRKHLQRARGGKSLTLDVIRRGEGKRIGIERAFTSFLRCARIPARLVEGLRLDSTTQRKRVFWTDVWSHGRWWPVSASQGLMGDLPTSYIGVARDGTRLLRVEGSATATYAVRARRLRDDT